jgi:DNA-binding FadR family transcriptional regulator
MEQSPTPQTSKPPLVARIRQMIDTAGYRHNDRLPPERELCALFDVSRHQLRAALSQLTADGLIWRHVGRGTFVGARPVLNLEDVQFLRDLVTPDQVVLVRLSIEPELARLAALHATQADIDQLQTCAKRCRAAQDWRGYEAWDNNLHHAVARASHNKLFLYFFETLNVVRRSMVWGQKRKTLRAAENYTSFQEHDTIVAAILDRDADAAGEAMRLHLKSVYTRVLPVLP